MDVVKAVPKGGLVIQSKDNGLSFATHYKTPLSQHTSRVSCLQVWAQRHQTI